MNPISRIIATSLVCVVCAATVLAQKNYSWRYYRLSNTGLQGDYCGAVWIGPDGDPYLGGYDPFFEEGGFAKFVQAEDRWINYSNVDYPVIGHPSNMGCVRIEDMVADRSGLLWMGTWTGALTFDPNIGAASLTNHDASNSPLIGHTTDVDLAPDGTMWFVSGGLRRFDPASSTWTSWDGGQVYLSAQPKSDGTYYVWSADRYFGYVFRFDSRTGAWTYWLPTTKGQVAGMPGKDCVDDVGNFWAFRMPAHPGDWETLDYMRADGTWVSPPPPYSGVTYDTWAFVAFGNAQAVLVDGAGTVWRFDGTSWHNLGVWRPGSYTFAVNVDAAQNIWVTGTGGAGRRDAATGRWQRYRITNTSMFTFWAEDIAVDDLHDHVYVGGNAGTGVGGMMRFDGQRWLGWNILTYGLGYDWPFPNDNCEALAYRPSNGRVVVSPLSWLYGIHEWTGSDFDQLKAQGGAVRLCEDSWSRVWALGEYYDLSYFDGSTWHSVPITAWGANIMKDRSRPGTVWACSGSEVVRTDGTYRFSRYPYDFPELDSGHDAFTTVAAAKNGIAWVGSNRGLLRLDASTGSHQFYSPSNSAIPGENVAPMAVSPDGVVWFTNFQSTYGTEWGLCWFDGTSFGIFPAPKDGGPQWGGLPHAQINDMEVRVIPGGYELWVSCLSRGIAVLTVRYAMEPGVPRATR